MRDFHGDLRELFVHAQRAPEIFIAGSHREDSVFALTILARPG